MQVRPCHGLDEAHGEKAMNLTKPTSLSGFHFILLLPGFPPIQEAVWKKLVTPPCNLLKANHDTD